MSAATRSWFRAPSRSPRSLARLARAIAIRPAVIGPGIGGYDLLDLVEHRLGQVDPSARDSRRREDRDLAGPCLGRHGSIGHRALGDGPDVEREVGIIEPQGGTRCASPSAAKA